MSGVVTAIGVAVVGTTATATVAATVGTIILVSVVLMVVSIGFSIYSMLSMKGFGGLDNSSKTKDRTHVVRSSIEPRAYIYGQAMVSGPLVYVLSTGSNNSILYMVVALAGHEVQAIGDVYLGDKLSTDPLFSGYLQITKYLGDPDQEADAELISASGGQWTIDHRLRGVAYLIVRLTFNSSVYPNGIPNIKAVVTGNNQIYDPRTDTYSYSNNWALCMYDYLSKSYGIKCDADEINQTQAILAANISDENVPLAAGGTEKRFTCNGVFSCEETPINIMQKLLTGALGSIVWSQGQYFTNPAVYKTPETYVITESDIVGDITVTPEKSTKDKFNIVKGVFIDPIQYWKPIDFPQVKNSTAIAKDGQELFEDITLDFTTSVSTAQRLAKIHLERELQSIVLSFTGKLTLFGFKPSDIIPVTLSCMGWSEKLFKIVNWELTENANVAIVMREESASSYDWNSGMETTVDPAPNTMLPDPFTVQSPTAIVLDDEVTSAAAGIVTRLLITLQAASDAFVSRYETEYRKQGETTWTTVGSGLTTTVTGVETGIVYEVRARAFNMLGVASAWVQQDHLVLGLSDPPSDVTGLRISVIGTTMHLYWDAVVEAGVSHYSIKYSPIESASWAGAIDLIPQAVGVSVTCPAMIGSYLVKAVRIGGAESVNEAYIYNSVGSAPLNAVETYTAETDWSGTLTNLTVDAGSISLTSLATIPAIGVFQPTETIDLGAVYTSRVSASLTVTGSGLTNTIDTWGSLSGLANLSGTDASLWSTFLELRKTDVDPALNTWSAWQQFNVGDYAARAFQFRLTLTSNSSNVQVSASSLIITVDMPDRTVTLLDQVCPVGGLRIDFIPQYRSLKSLVIDPANLATGDYKTVTNKDESGFNVRFFNSSGTGVERTFDAVAVGYGEV
jgi:hypothetical protein